MVYGHNVEASGAGPSGGVGGGAIAGWSGAGAEDNFNLDVDVYLTGAEVIVDIGASGKSVEHRLIDEEEQLVDYDSEPNYYETEAKQMAYVAQRSSVKGDVIEMDKADWFNKVEESEKLTPLFQNMDELSKKESDKRIASWKYSMELKMFIVKKRGGSINYLSNRK